MCYYWLPILAEDKTARLTEVLALDYTYMYIVAVGSLYTRFIPGVNRDFAS